MSGELLAEVYCVLRRHAELKRLSNPANLARQIGDVLRQDSRRPIVMAAAKAERVHVVKEQWPMERVLQFKGNSKLFDGDDTIPLVVFTIDGEDKLVDGGKRVTRWRTHGHTHRPWVLIVSLSPRA